jgi:hypothetical protein
VNLCHPSSLLGKISKDVPAAQMDCWRRHFLCRPCRFKGVQAISSCYKKKEVYLVSYGFVSTRRFNCSPDFVAVGISFQFRQIKK